jgi:cysteinyl-tRNA synthetase
MSKRFGNITTARDLREDGVDPAAIRLLVSQTHYRQELDLTDEALAAAREGSRRLGELDRRLRAASGSAGPGFASLTARTEAEFTEALDDDLNAPRAVASLFDFAREANRLMDAGEAPGPETVAGWTRWSGTVLDLIPTERTVDAALQAWIAERLAERMAAKKRRDFAAADAIRAELSGRGILIEDTPAGPKWRLA